MVRSPTNVFAAARKKSMSSCAFVLSAEIMELHEALNSELNTEVKLATADK
jgi:hypothetical protein